MWVAVLQCKHTYIKVVSLLPPWLAFINHQSASLYNYAMTEETAEQLRSHAHLNFLHELYLTFFTFPRKIL